MTFNPSDHVIIMERKSKKKDSQGRETWEVTKTEYLPVQWRLYWFRLENQKGKIDSRAFTIDLEKGAAIFETLVEREDGGSARMHGSETQGDWRDYIEKAQTKSLGRALAAVGYGSQFTDDEFAEGERIVDSPVARSHATHDTTPAPRQNGHQGGAPVESLKPSEVDGLKSYVGKVFKFKQEDFDTRWLAYKKFRLNRQVDDMSLTLLDATTLRDFAEKEEAKNGAVTQAN